ncbi:MAG: DUF397 domain-containing protein [Pseudonocardiaceae bacterium]
MALTCLLDTSVWNRLDWAPTLAAEVTTLVQHGEVGHSDIERIEVLRSATGHDVSEGEEPTIPTLDISGTSWCKSSRSSNIANYVEVAAVDVRDSKNLAGSVLTVPPLPVYVAAAEAREAVWASEDARRGRDP